MMSLAFLPPQHRPPTPSTGVTSLPFSHIPAAAARSSRRPPTFSSSSGVSPLALRGPTPVGQMPLCGASPQLGVATPSAEKMLCSQLAPFFLPSPPPHPPSSRLRHHMGVPAAAPFLPHPVTYTHPVT
ncbi:Os04g0493050 [Oryza sativa Japonica Group]|uniref:Os04g0493050 protein n=1 Tax=Oryza sativa subsp. japonica TaxID=39947 RepID=A0A0P0WBV0_ORYSJ|nr:Os04g0493050 [Oryza sativa Japonica Group]